MHHDSGFLAGLSCSMSPNFLGAPMKMNIVSLITITPFVPKEPNHQAFVHSPLMRLKYLQEQLRLIGHRRCGQDIVLLTVSQDHLSAAVSHGPYRKLCLRSLG